MALLVDGEQQLAVRVECYAGDIGPMRKGQSVRLVVHQVEYSDSIADRRQELCAIPSVDEITFAIDRTKQV